MTPYKYKGVIFILLKITTRSILFSFDKILQVKKRCDSLKLRYPNLVRHLLV